MSATGQFLLALDIRGPKASQAFPDRTKPEGMVCNELLGFTTSTLLTAACILPDAGDQGGTAARGSDRPSGDTFVRIGRCGSLWKVKRLNVLGALGCHLPDGIQSNER